jgi:hypothetical protein
MFYLYPPFPETPPWFNVLRYLVHVVLVGRSVVALLRLVSFFEGGWQRFIDTVAPGTLLVPMSLADSLRQETRRYEMPPQTLQRDNPHAAAAATRASACAVIEAVAATAGYSIYSVSKSSRDIRRGVKGSRPLRDTKDLSYYSKAVHAEGMHEREAVFLQEVNKFIDVDSHLSDAEMRSWMTSSAITTFYTWCPTSPAGMADETTFRYNRMTDLWEFNSPGSGVGYTQKLWDFTPDAVTSVKCVRPRSRFTYGPCSLGRLVCLCVLLLATIDLVLLALGHRPPSDWMLSPMASLYQIAVVALVYLLCCRLTGVVRRVYRYDVAPHRSIVWTVPVRRFGLLGVLLRWRNFTTPEGDVAPAFGRLVPTQVKGTETTYEALRTTTSRGDITTIVHSGTSTPIEIPDYLFAQVRGAGTSGSKDPLRAGSFKTNNNTYGPDRFSELFKSHSNYDAMAIIDYVRSSGGLETRVASLPYQKQFVPSYFFTSPGDEELREAMMWFWCSPLIPGGARVAGQSIGNDERFIQERMEKVRAPACGLTTRDVALMKEFIDEISIGFELLNPSSSAEVAERQKTPRQLRQIEEGDSNLDLIERSVLEQFQKREIYPDLKDPRGITMFPPGPKLAGSMVMGIFAECLKHQRWYGFGKSPLETAEQVGQVANYSRFFALETDFKRYDGTISYPLRMFELLLLTSLFDPKWRVWVKQWHDLDYDNTVRTKSRGTGSSRRYKQGAARGSGSPGTSSLNTVINALVVYIAFRNSHAPGSSRRFTHEEAIDKLNHSVFGGDDGLTPDLDPDEIQRVCEHFGLQIKPLRREREKDTVSFLARVYGPGVWYGDPNSMCSFKRTCTSFPTTGRVRTTPLHMVAHDKASSLLFSDRNTPLLGRWLAALIAITKPQLRANYTVDYSESWTATRVVGFGGDPAHVAYPNHEEPWMHHVIEEELGGWPEEFENYVGRLETMLAHGDIIPEITWANPPAMVGWEAPPHPPADVIDDGQQGAIISGTAPTAPPPDQQAMAVAQAVPEAVNEAHPPAALAVAQLFDQQVADLTLASHAAEVALIEPFDGDPAGGYADYYARVYGAASPQLRHRLNTAQSALAWCKSLSIMFTRTYSTPDKRWVVRATGTDTFGGPGPTLQSHGTTVKEAERRAATAWMTHSGASLSPAKAKPPVETNTTPDVPAGLTPDPAPATLEGNEDKPPESKRQAKSKAWNADHPPTRGGRGRGRAAAPASPGGPA